MSNRPSVMIVGAGLAGCLLARLLGRAGFEVLVCERREDPRLQKHATGRSINLAISARGINAMKEAGLEDELLEHAIPMPGRMIHDLNAGTSFQPYSSDPRRAINSVSRSELNLLLLEGADACDSVRFQFGWRCMKVDHVQGEVLFQDEDGREHRDHADLVVGADGAYSAVRASLQFSEQFNYSQDYLAHGYKELSIPPTTTGPHAPFAIEPGALHIWPHGGSMMIALPNRDGSFTCTLFWPHAGEHSFEAVDAGNVRAFFRSHYPDAVDLMPELEQEFAENPVGALCTIRCRPWHRGRAVLIGDAAHAVVPFYGQGANASFEDALELAERLIESPTDPDDAVERYYQARVDHADAIADMAIANFIEMRDHTGRRSFRAKKGLERMLHRSLDERFLPLYEMVSFTTIPYADARRKAQRQWDMVATVFVLSIALLIIVVALLLA